MQLVSFVASAGALLVVATAHAKATVEAAHETRDSLCTTMCAHVCTRRTCITNHGGWQSGERLGGCDAVQVAVQENTRHKSLLLLLRSALLASRFPAPRWQARGHPPKQKSWTPVLGIGRSSGTNKGTGALTGSNILGVMVLLKVDLESLTDDGESCSTNE
jgi:hypothetical protein